jgi:hypothetical protein
MNTDQQDLVRDARDMVELLGLLAPALSMDKLPDDAAHGLWLILSDIKQRLETAAA